MGIIVVDSVLSGPLAGRDARAVPWFLALVSVVGMVPSTLAVAVDSRATAFATIWIFIPIPYAFFGPTLGLVQNLVPASMRPATRESPCLAPGGPVLWPQRALVTQFMD